jgi:hypothetical protein
VIAVIAALRRGNSGGQAPEAGKGNPMLATRAFNTAAYRIAANAAERRGQWGYAIDLWQMAIDGYPAALRATRSWRYHRARWRALLELLTGI